MISKQGFVALRNMPFRSKNADSCCELDLTARRAKLLRIEITRTENSYLPVVMCECVRIASFPPLDQNATVLGKGIVYKPRESSNFATKELTHIVGFDI